MPLFIWNCEGCPPCVFGHLFKICDDGNLGYAPTINPCLLQVIYAPPSASGFTKGILKKIVNNTSHDIVIAGMDSTWPYQGLTLIDRGGGVTIDDPALPGLLTIVYDVTDCNGNYYCDYDESNNPVIVSSYEVLFHELMHAYRHDKGMLDSEVQVRIDENKYRQEKGLTPLNPTNLEYVGCGQCAEGNNCFIVSAVSGSEYSPQVNRFRRLRDLYLRQTTLGDGFFTELFQEYYQLSAWIVGAMQLDPALKRGIARLVVEPLLDFFHVLEIYLKGDSGIREVNEQLEQVFLVLGQRFQWGSQPEEVVKTVSYLARYQMPFINMFGSELRFILPNLGNTTPSPNNPDFGLGSRKEPFHFITWALGEPLAFLWSTSKLIPQLKAEGISLAHHFAQWVGQWLEKVPVPTCFTDLDQETILQDLMRFSLTVFTVPSVRQSLGTRLLKSYGTQVPYDLEYLLRLSGYLKLN